MLPAVYFPIAPLEESIDTPTVHHCLYASVTNRLVDGRWCQFVSVDERERSTDLERVPVTRLTHRLDLRVNRRYTFG